MFLRTANPAWALRLVHSTVVEEGPIPVQVERVSSAGFATSIEPSRGEGFGGAHGCSAATAGLQRAVE